MTLAGSTALVTGGGTGVGAAIALALAQAGADVLIAGRNEPALRDSAARHAAIRWQVADVTDEAAVATLFEAAGPRDIVVANAGAGSAAPLRKTTLADWNSTVAVNLTGCFLTFREGLRRMPPGRGRLIAIASTAGLQGAAYIAPYAAAKHGVLGLTRSLAMEVARDGITVNAICPGYVDTPMTERSVANIAARTAMTDSEARAWLVGTNPAGRLIRPDEVAATAVWLCSDASAMVNGQAITLSGGAP